MAADGVPPEIEEELETVRAIYGEEAVRVLDAPPLASATGDLLHFQVDLQPRVAQGTALVSLCLQVALPAGYPAAAAPRFTVERSRGIADAGVRAVLDAAGKAAEEYGLQEDGCISLILAEVSDALDTANDASECSICLAPCGSSESVHTAC